MSAKPETQRQARSNVVLVDGSNVAHSSEGGAPRLANILVVRDKLIEDGLDPIIVVDAALRHQIDDDRRFEELVEGGTIRQAPAGTDADYFLLEFAEEFDASIVSNDRFRDRIEKYPELRSRLVKYMIVGDEVVLERRVSRRP
ncbi:MAG TPA: hypothetical protein VFT96_13140 [Gemmatimonadaceae bacterium]|nr:hypothetical protein [Gemmatimonadaceae bacterium]